METAPYVVPANGRLRAIAAGAAVAMSACSSQAPVPLYGGAPGDDSEGPIVDSSYLDLTIARDSASVEEPDVTMYQDTLTTQDSGTPVDVTTQADSGADAPEGE